MPIFAVKAIVVIMLLVIVGSLMSALVFLYKDQGRGTRAAKALTVRITVSILLFLLLMAGFHFGIIPSAGIR